MSTFKTYSRYYDLLYFDKDYVGEADYIASLIHRHAPDARHVLELGSGTGKHAALLAEKGYSVHGVDLSEAMLAQAQARRLQLPDTQQERLQFTHGNVQSCKVARTDGKGGCFDAAISLFHVVSYQNLNADLLAMFSNAAAHLATGGVFICDYWYGPAVLTDRPARREKHMENDEIVVERIATPTLHATRNLVDVHYMISIRDKKSDTVEYLEETHHMRYLFTPEIAQLAEASGFELVHSEEWMTGQTPDFNTWGVVSVLKKR